MGTEVERSGQAEKVTESTPKTSIRLTILLCIGLIVTYMAQGILITASKNESGGYDYDENVSVLLSEVCKFFMSATLLLYQLKKKRPRDAPPLTSPLGISSFKFAVPALLYALHNNIIFIALELLSPVTYQLFNNIKIVTTGMVFRIFLRRPLRMNQWMAILLLLLSMCVTQLNCENAASGGTDEKILQGFLWMIALSCCSAFAGVYNEFLLKNGVQSSLMWKNMQLYFFGAISCMIPYIYTRMERKTLGDPMAFQNPLVGFGPMAWGVVLMNGLLGQIISAIFFYADNIVKVYAASGAVLLTPFVSHYFFYTPLHIPLFLGIGVCLISLFLYFLPQNQLFTTDVDLFKHLSWRRRDGYASVRTIERV